MQGLGCHGLGGRPDQRDKIWFFALFREWGSERQGAGKFWNLTQGTMFYTPDLDRPATGYEWDESKAGAHHVAGVTETS